MAFKQQSSLNSAGEYIAEARFAETIEESLRLIDDLKFFLATAPANWQENQIIRRYYLNDREGFISCVYWKNIYYITGTDIVRGISYKFNHFGRQILDQKKFEEGIFSDLRSLKCGTDAVLENPRSPFLKFLHKNQCLRTQKKQKVFFWFSVPHDKLFSDALERDLKRELDGKQNATTKASFEPALSFNYNASKPLLDQVVHHLESTWRQRGFDYNVTDETAAASDSENAVSAEGTGVNAIVKDEDILLGTPNDGATPLTFSTKITPQQLTIPAQNEDDNFDDPVEIGSEDENQLKAIAEDDDAYDDFPLDYFQAADTLSAQQELLDPHKFFQSEISQPFLIDQSEKLVPPANSNYLIHQTQRSANEHQIQQQQMVMQQALMMQYYPSYEYDAPYAADYSQQHAEAYSHFHPYHVSFQQPFIAAQPTPVAFNTFNPFHYELQQQHLQMQAAQIFAHQQHLGGFPSSQATAPPPGSAVPKVGVFTNAITKRKFKSQPLSAHKMAKTSSGSKDISAKVKRNAEEGHRKKVEKTVKIEDDDRSNLSEILIED